MKVEEMTIRYGEDSAELVGYLREGLEAQAGRKRPAVIICPGGAYERCSDRESEPVAAQFLALGFQSFVLEYSVAPAVFPTALVQLAMAVAYIKKYADEWDIDKNKILVCGFSAGAHLAASLGVFWNRKEIYGKTEAWEHPENIRPDRLLLAYPVITSGEYGHQPSFRNLLGEDYGKKEKMDLVSLEKQAGSHVPPVFMWHTNKDATVPAENSLLFAMALRKAGVSLEYHLFPEGRHGLSLATADSAKAGQESEYIVPCCSQWFSLAKEWLKEWQPGIESISGRKRKKTK